MLLNKTKRICQAIASRCTFSTKYIIIISVFGALIGCQPTVMKLIPDPDKPTIQITTILPTSKPPEVEKGDKNTPTPFATLQPQSEQPLQLSTYTITATLNYESHHLIVEEEINYFHPAHETIQELVIMVEAAYYPGVFQLNDIQINNETIGETFWTPGQLHAVLNEPLSFGQERIIKIKYELFLPKPNPSPDVQPIPFGYTDNQVNLVDWYPFIPPYKENTGWLAHEAGFFGEHLVYDISNFKIAFRIESNFPELVVAASSHPLREANWYMYKHEKARNFAISVSPAYEVQTDQVGNTTITSYAFKPHHEASVRVLKTAAEALSLFNELYGTYPRDTLAIVEADFLDGMEYDGLFFLSNGFYNLYDGTASNYLIDITAHETAHQWFYGLVANDQALEPWLDEALCTYNERIYYERYAPEAIEWWENIRINYYRPKGWLDTDIYSFNGYRAYRDAVYLNGAVFLEELRSVMGDKAFFQFLNTYIQQQQYQIATGRDFFELLDATLTEDYTPLLQEFFQELP